MNLKNIFGIALLSIMGYLIFPFNELKLKTNLPQIGEVSLKAIVSPRNFDIPKDSLELYKERVRAKESVLFVFEEDEDRTHQYRLKFYELIEDIKSFGSLAEKLDGKLPSKQREEITQNSSLLFEKITRQISPSALSSISKKPQVLEILSKHFNEILKAGVSEDFLAPNKRNLELYKKQFNLNSPKYILYNKDQIKLIRGNKESTIPLRNIRTAEIRVENHFENIKRNFPNDQSLLSAIYETLYASVGPNIFFMKDETKSRQIKEAQEILTIKGKVLEGTTIISPGEIITQEVLDKLSALKKVLARTDDFATSYFLKIAIFVLILIIAFAYVQFLTKRHPRWLSDNRFSIALLLIPLLQLALTSVNIQLEREFNGIMQNFQIQQINTWYITPFSFASILGTVLFSFEVGLVLGVFSSIYFTMLTGFDLSLFLTSFATCFVISWQLRNIKYRSQFILAALLGSMAFTIMIFITSLLHSQFEIPAILIEAGFAAANTIITVAISGLIFIPFFEKVFKITTNLTLIELSDFNHPALRHISSNAPSTFHHSIMVGNLAEKAVERIDGNPLLVRVMALYHDIGKTMKPEYFAENQKGPKSKHDDMSPKESSKIIADHVHEAIELATKYRLPPLIISGIPEHHGTGLIKYFYHKAKEQGLKPNKEDYQYGGPKPQRKETVALMVADAVEATTRSLKDPEPQELAEVVHKVIQTRLYENQFDEADVTLKDLKEMEIGFLQALEGMFHTRIAYPKNIWLEKPKGAS